MDSARLPAISDRRRSSLKIDSGATPALIAGAGARAEKRFWEFFTAHIRNPNTRSAYFRAVTAFLAWCEAHRLSLGEIEPMMVAAYIEQHPGSAPTLKQHLAAIRRLFDWLVIGQVVPFNPASPVRGPKHVVKVGKTPVPSADEVRGLFDAIDLSTRVGLRDRALIGLMVFSFARISATLAMQVRDYYHQGKRSYFRLHEKGGKYHVVPAHHKAQAFLDAYLEAAGIAEENKTPLFRSSGRGRNRNRLTERGLGRWSALQMVKRRALGAGLPPELCNHSFRGAGITEYLKNGGAIETAARIAGHESTRTTQLYDRSFEAISLDEIERIHI
jgi:site-specific recombinase XerD